MSRIRKLINERFQRLRFGFLAVVGVFEKTKGEIVAMATKRASEELIAAPLPDLIRDLGLAVAEANRELTKIDDMDLVYTVDHAAIELSVAISIDSTSKLDVAGGAKLSVFNVNASYARTYGFKEEASSKIKLTLAAKPLPAPAA